MAGAIGQAFDRRVAAEAKIRFTRGRDRPEAQLLAQFEQRAAMLALDRLVIRLRLRPRVQRPQHVILQPRQRSRAASLAAVLARRASFIAALLARKIEAGEFADHGVAADPDIVGGLPAGAPRLRPDLSHAQAL